ncbi:MAG: Fis family transcriptional regulator [Desulfitibacter sp. BRH_c19]|nr:MAG: Fis family transcriptional regulator [Desulfitibacter sp. BRH_c19]
MNILLVDDDRHGRSSVADFLNQLGHHVVECDDGREALEIYKSGEFPMVLTDIKMPHLSGVELLKAISKLPKYSETDVVIYTGHGELETAISALRSGAYDYLLKPLNVEELAVLTERIAEHQALRRENKKLTEHFDSELETATKESREETQRLRKLMAKYTGLDSIGIFSDQMKLIVRQTQMYHVDRSIPVIIQGETGTGKEVIARLIHFGETGTATNFVDINCAALTPSLFESELFGYEAGSYTGGLSKGQQGKIDIAKGGTLFLDEITEIPLELQGKLLRVIQEKEFYRVGGLKKIQTDVRLICATNSNLEKQVTDGKFRKDLYYRLKVGHIIIPPLRERMDDIIKLAQMFLEQFSKQKKKNFRSISKNAQQELLTYSWPGNVRELKNIIEWAVFMYDDIEIKPHHLKLIKNNQKSVETYQTNNADNFSLPTKSFPLNQFVDEVIEEALEKHQGNKAKTARYLGISRRSLYSHLERMAKHERE